MLEEKSGWPKHAIGGRAIELAGGIVEAQHAVVGEIGDPQAAGAIDGHARRFVHRAGRDTAVVGSVGGEVGLPQYAISRCAIGLAGGIVEAQHAVIGKIGDPQTSRATGRDPMGLPHAAGREIAAVNDVGGEVRLAEHAIGGRAIGLAGGIVEAQHAVVI